MRPGSLRGGLAAAALATVLAAPPAARAAAGAPAPGGAPGLHAAFYEPGSRARFAFVDAPVTVRDRPYWDGVHLARLGTRTPDGTDEVVAVRDLRTDRDGRSWARVPFPSLPNGRTGWIPRSALGEVRQTDQWLRVDRRALRVRLMQGGRTAFSARIGVGRPQWPTPAGDFIVRSRLRGRSLGALYGPLAFGLTARSAVLTDWPGGGYIGVHGTDEPGLLPGRVSHGCIRLRNADVLRLGRLLHVGTPVTIS